MIIIGYNDPVTITVARLHLDRARQCLERELVRAKVARAKAVGADTVRKMRHAEELTRSVEATECALEAIVFAIGHFDAPDLIKPPAA